MVFKAGAGSASGNSYRLHNSIIKNQKNFLKVFVLVWFFLKKRQREEKVLPVDLSRGFPEVASNKCPDIACALGEAVATVLRRLMGDQGFISHGAQSGGYSGGRG